MPIVRFADYDWAFPVGDRRFVVPDVRAPPLGLGAVGVVYPAMYCGRLCAAKALHAFLDPDLYGLDDDASLVQDVAREACRELSVLAKLHHPCVLPLVGVAYENMAGVEIAKWIITEMMDESLHSLLCGRGVQMLLSKVDAARIARDICSGLTYLHSNKVAHRDLKPTNVLVNATGAKLGDMGTAKTVETLVTSHTVGVGTLSYMAPESMSPHHDPYLADIYAIGVTLVVLCTSEDPVRRGANFPEDFPAWADQKRRASLAHADLASLITDCCTTDPLRRPKVAALCDATCALVARLDVCEAEGDCVGSSLRSILMARAEAALLSIPDATQAIDKMLAEEVDDGVVLQWIASHVSAANSARIDFAVGVMNCVLKFIARNLGLHNGRKLFDESDTQRVENLVNKYSPVLQKLVGDSLLAQKALVFEIQRFCYNLAESNGGPSPGLLEHLFDYFWFSGVVSEEAIDAWRLDEADTTPGKAAALKELDQWLQWLENPEEVSDEDGGPTTGAAPSTLRYGRGVGGGADAASGVGPSVRHPAAYKPAVSGAAARVANAVPAVPAATTTTGTSAPKSGAAAAPVRGGAAGVATGRSDGPTAAKGAPAPYGSLTEETSITRTGAGSTRGGGGGGSGGAIGGGGGGKGASSGSPAAPQTHNTAGDQQDVDGFQPASALNRHQRRYARTTESPSSPFLSRRPPQPASRPASTASQHSPKSIAAPPRSAASVQGRARGRRSQPRTRPR